jgi:hypothetical protein
MSKQERRNTISIGINKIKNQNLKNQKIKKISKKEKINSNKKN